MQFAHPIWLLTGVAACGILSLSFYLFQKKSTAALQEFASGRLLEKLTLGVSPGKRMIKRIILVMAVAAIFVALARPQMGFQWKEVKRKGIDILMAVDTSKSMLAEDVKPNRLERSKFGIMDFVSKLEGDRVGLLPFAGSAFLMCPLTLDYDAFGNSLESLDTDIIPQGGTNLAGAIREAEFAFSNNANHKILVLVTDGEDLAGEALSAASEAAKKGMTLYTIGVGTPSGELIPFKDGAFVKDENGRPVKSRLDESMLQKIAEATGGRYEPLGQQAQGLDAIYREKLSLVPKQALAERMRKVPIERYQWPIMFALILLLTEFAVSDRKRNGKAMPIIKTAYRRIPKIGRAAGAASIAALVLLVIVLLGYRSAHASPGSAEAAYKAGKYDLAVEGYQSEVQKAPEEPQLQFNLGTAAYKGKQYARALTAFKHALKVQDMTLQNRSYYNMGNTLYRQGEQTEKKNPRGTIKNWEASIQSYNNALKLNPEDRDAAFNRDFVKKRLEALKKNQNKKNCNKCDNKDNKDPKKDNRNKDKRENRQAGKQDPTQNQNKGARDKKIAQNQKENSGNKDKQQRSQQNESAKSDSRKNKNDKSDHKKENRGLAKKDPAKPAKEPDKNRVELGSERRRPGQMTREQARNLLDSLKGDEKAMPMTARNMSMGGNPKDPKRRDW